MGQIWHSSHLWSGSSDCGARPRLCRNGKSRRDDLAQCRSWIRANLPEIDEIAVNSTAVAAMLASKDGNIAAVCTPLAAEQYGLKPVSMKVQDSENNITRFFVVGNAKSVISGYDKTSMLFTVKNEKGTLSKILHIFENNNINIVMIESRPSKNINWEYIFYVDIEGHKDEQNVKMALSGIAQQTQSLRILGSYPNAQSQ